MAKKYVEELAAWVRESRTNRPRQDTNMVAFLAIRADVQEAIAAGYAVKTIWEHLNETGRIPYRYETFLKHVRRHITSDTIAGSKPRSVQPQKIERKEPPSVGGFNFNPKPQKEDLV